MIDKRPRGGYIVPITAMDRLTALRTLSSRIAVVLLAVILCGAPVSAILATPPATCVPGAGSSAPWASAQAHTCCYGETDACCCDVSQGSTAALPDMALAAVSGAEYQLAPRSAASDTGVQTVSSPPLFTSTERWTGSGPPLTLSYLVNLTIRC